MSDPHTLMMPRLQFQIGVRGMAITRLIRLPSQRRLPAVRVRDGHIVERQKMLGWRSRNLLPLIHDNILYVPSCTFDDGPSRLEAYAIGR